MGTFDVPRTPVDVPANSHSIWPVNFDLKGAGTLLYSTAQLLYKVDCKTEPTYFFFAVPGMRTEFAFSSANVSSVQASNGTVTHGDGAILVQGVEPGKNALLDVTGQSGAQARILLLTETLAEEFWQVPTESRETVLLSAADIFVDIDGIHLRSIVPSRLTASVFAPDSEQNSPQGLWKEKTWQVEPRKVDYVWSNNRDAGTRPAIRMAPRAEWRDRAVPQAPEEADFASAAAWTIVVKPQSMEGLSDIYLRIRYAGDIARLSLDGRVLDDDFYNGRCWEIGLNRFLPEAFGKKLDVSVLPLPQKAPIYLDARAWKLMNTDGQTARITDVELLPEYEVVFNPLIP
jgi:hypothetical protein